MHLFLQPVEMTPSLMQELEDKGLILRLAPGRFAPAVNGDEPPPTEVYSSADEFGPHKLIACALNTTEATRNFNFHPDREEFLLIGNPESRPAFLVISRLLAPAFEEKARAKKLSPDDFVALRMKFNDPQVSFFTMNATVPHGEVTVPGSGAPATFFVTESRDITGLKPDLGGYTWEVARG
ncbi:MAG TPA: hypothetical protein VF338_06770 [Leptolinea sp.]